MKKIAEGRYIYKGVEVERFGGTGIYIAKVYVNDKALPMTICGATQSAFKKIFNEQVKLYGGLKIK